MGKVPLICITSRQPCRTLCWQEITVFVTFSQGPPFGSDGPCDHTSSQQAGWTQWHVFLCAERGRGVRGKWLHSFQSEKIINTWRTNAATYGIIIQIEVNLSKTWENYRPQCNCLRKINLEQSELGEGRRQERGALDERAGERQRDIVASINCVWKSNFK